MRRPNYLKTRGETYSNYESPDTVKYLIGTSPYGKIIFIFNGFGGQASEKIIVENSEFLIICCQVLR